MKITKDVVVSIAYQVKNEDGIVVDESTKEMPLQYLQGHNNLIVGLENALEGREAGDTFEVTVAPEEAYGEYLDAMVQRVPADVFQGVDEIVVGMRFLAETDQGQIPVEVTEVDGDEVVVDGNHMLAGQTLTFNVEVVDVRAATEEEIAHGHIHQSGGCCGGHDHDHEGGCCGGDGHGCCGGEDKGDDHECCGGGGCGSH
ncbi:peptidylprolyl isomerase [Grimontia hollisae]|uniref:Peptidyl-prolyl cis-trans isomerase n=2 Tax=Grimontia hollisae TaxID=673 RepID=D0I3Q6_GRIHO|nr:peptidylprolyl isomerase [Grimontia hollisae]AMG30374.1 peptidylprolyl isomerase [Grimontia hollisae]EEY73684.1 FKBP-type peptidyl-prolyl cis-trans isomerase SlyD [Grimontia hollisae CIP 101886]STO42078.1 FKBP-type peptidyl-prolyl cis-trans isomerase slyD [Grimontia hollisae]STO55975.1 FKBP-type peptidyl-prolyl cis-trans isomerase slyD [Grimontia hollisae]STQ77704.1 FKBP-type peptidyl-prolyl cis-trans isomerase slyD [Grimontia hollisae]